MSDRWVVLKGLLNSGDPDAMAAAINERQFLAQVEHPLIVEIYDFVTREGAGYIVMEYVGGPSLEQLLQAADRRPAGVAAAGDQALAYVLEVLPALGYLHDRDLLYCDFKPDNVIQAGDQLKLIDLGGVRRLDDVDSAIYGTPGYQAPEVPRSGRRSPRTSTRSAARWPCSRWSSAATSPPTSPHLPAIDQTPLFQAYDSLYRLLLKACAPDPADRFVSADELRVQLLGVLARSWRPARARPALHVLAAVQVAVGVRRRLDWQELPACASTTATTAPWLRALDRRSRGAPGGTGGGPPRHPEVRLARAQRWSRWLRPGRHTAQQLLDEDPWEWRAVWLAGLVAPAEGRTADAPSAFNTVYGQVPGELAPKLALASPASAAAKGRSPSRSTSRARARRQLQRARRVRPRPHPVRLAGTSTVRSGSSTSSRGPAGAFTSARRRRGKPAGRVGWWAPRRSRPPYQSIDNLTIDPVDRSRFRAEVLQTALATSSSRTGSTRRSPSVDIRPRSRSSATGWRLSIASWRSTPARRGRSASGWSTRRTTCAGGLFDDTADRQRRREPSGA